MLEEVLAEVIMMFPALLLAVLVAVATAMEEMAKQTQEAAAEEAEGIIRIQIYFTKEELVVPALSVFALLLLHKRERSVRYEIRIS